MARRMKLKINVTQLLFFLKRFLTREMDLMWNLKKKIHRGKTEQFIILL